MSEEKKTEEEERIAALVREHGELRGVKTRFGMVAVRTPDRDEYEALQAKVDDPKQNTAPLVRTFVKKFCVTHTPAELEELFDRIPGLPDRMVGGCAELAGAKDEVVALKA